MTKRKAPRKEKLRYLLKPREWSVDHSFGVGYYLSRLIENDMGESSILLVGCELKSPKVENVKKVKITLRETNTFDKILTKRHQKGDVERVGFISKPRGKNHLLFDIWVPSKNFRNITLAFGFNKVEYISVFGSKLWYGKGEIYQVYLGTDEKFDFTEND